MKNRNIFGEMRKFDQLENAQEFVKLYFDIDSVIFTFEHPFFVNNDWKEAKDLKQGDSLFAYSGVNLRIASV